MTSSKGLLLRSKDKYGSKTTNSMRQDPNARTEIEMRAAPFVILGCMELWLGGRRAGGVLESVISRWQCRCSVLNARWCAWEPKKESDQQHQQQCQHTNLENTRVFAYESPCNLMSILLLMANIARLINLAHVYVFLVTLARLVHQYTLSTHPDAFSPISPLGCGPGKSLSLQSRCSQFPANRWV